MTEEAEERDGAAENGGERDEACRAGRASSCGAERRGGKRADADAGDASKAMSHVGGGGFGEGLLHWEATDSPSEARSAICGALLKSALYRDLAALSSAPPGGTRPAATGACPKSMMLIAWARCSRAATGCAFTTRPRRRAGGAQLSHCGAARAAATTTIKVRGLDDQNAGRRRRVVFHRGGELPRSRCRLGTWCTTAHERVAAAAGLERARARASWPPYVLCSSSAPPF